MKDLTKVGEITTNCEEALEKTSKCLKVLPPFQNKKRLRKSGLKSSIIDIYERFFLIHRYEFDWT
jgi:hypothetical protein